jgi:hypothetical protein
VLEFSRCPTAALAVPTLKSLVAVSTESALHKKITRGAVTHPCWYPGCKCRDYEPEKHK